jgi:hypothetical protein
VVKPHADAICTGPRSNKRSEKKRREEKRREENETSNLPKIFQISESKPTDTAGIVPSQPSSAFPKLTFSFSITPSPSLLAVLRTEAIAPGSVDSEEFMSSLACAIDRSYIVSL